MEETKICPKCNLRMIKWRRRITLLSNPPQYPWDWKCLCGYKEVGGVDRELFDIERFTIAWKKAQD